MKIIYQKGIKECTMVLGGLRRSMVAVEMFGWAGLDSLTETKDGEDQRQQCRSMRDNAIRIL
jgi:hypothetical protein